jgi:hypothetical protein
MHLQSNINPLNAKLNPICHSLALLGAHPILHISMVRCKWYYEGTLYNTHKQWHIVSGSFTEFAAGHH